MVSLGWDIPLDPDHIILSRQRVQFAKYLDKMAGATSINVIESFLEVTEIGAVSKMLKRKGSKLEPVISPR